MPAEDGYHKTVVRALIKDGWTIIQEQVPIRIGRRRLWIDIQAGKLGEHSIILVEVKNIQGASLVEALRDTIGQYLLYRAALNFINAEDHQLFLAISLENYHGILSEPLGIAVIQEVKLSLLVFNPESEEIELWLP